MDSKSITIITASFIVVLSLGALVVEEMGKNVSANKAQLEQDLAVMHRRVAELEKTMRQSLSAPGEQSTGVIRDGIRTTGGSSGPDSAISVISGDNQAAGIVLKSGVGAASRMVFDGKANTLQLHVDSAPDAGLVLDGNAGEVHISKLDTRNGTTKLGGTSLMTGATLDVSAGTLHLSNDQISGDSVEGGTIHAVTIDTLTSTTINSDVVTAGNVRLDTNSVTTSSSDLALSSHSGNVVLQPASAKLQLGANQLSIPDDSISGDKVEGGTINAVTINTLTSGRVNANQVTTASGNLALGAASNVVKLDSGTTLDASAGGHVNVGGTGGKWCKTDGTKVVCDEASPLSSAATAGSFCMATGPDQVKCDSFSTSPDWNKHFGASESLNSKQHLEFLDGPGAALNAMGGACIFAAFQFGQLIPTPSAPPDVPRASTQGFFVTAGTVDLKCEDACAQHHSGAHSPSARFAIKWLNYPDYPAQYGFWHTDVYGAHTICCCFCEDKPAMPLFHKIVN